ncbi:class I SAM-dependent methyltransferase [Roseiconus nitratireducens]|nr:class I SAM-dependent methyltransferase [Roseiconus nitratireducens]
MLKVFRRPAEATFGRIRDRLHPNRQCPICDWTGYAFSKGGAPNKSRFDCRCPNCGAVERHRLAFMVAEKLDGLDYSDVLHVAPEKELSNYLRSKATNYLSIDLYSQAMARMDITALELPDQSQSLIWISHVLEHVENDAAAIAEMSRVLRPGGTVIAQVPIWRQSTYEDFSITDPNDRLEHFYQTDHVRLYGIDVVDRFCSRGFEAEVHRAQDFGPERLVRHGLSFVSTNEVFRFRKAA